MTKNFYELWRMEKFKDFEDWLKGTHHLNWRETISSMHTIDKVLMVPDMEKINSVSILNQLLSALRNNVSFASKAKTQSDKDVKTFKLFIQFKESQKALKDS
jgi:hypothetical protein